MSKDKKKKKLGGLLDAAKTAAGAVKKTVETAQSAAAESTAKVNTIPRVQTDKDRVGNTGDNAGFGSVKTDKPAKTTAPFSQRKNPFETGRQRQSLPSIGDKYFDKQSEVIKKKLKETKVKPGDVKAVAKYTANAFKAAADSQPFSAKQKEKRRAMENTVQGQAVKREREIKRLAENPGKIKNTADAESVSKFNSNEKARVLNPSYDKAGAKAELYKNLVPAKPGEDGAVRIDPITIPLDEHKYITGLAPGWYKLDEEYTPSKLEYYEYLDTPKYKTSKVDTTAEKGYNDLVRDTKNRTSPVTASVGGDIGYEDETEKQFAQAQKEGKPYIAFSFKDFGSHVIKTDVSETYADKNIYNALDYMTEDEYKSFMYLYGKYGNESVESFFNWRGQSIAERIQSERENKGWEKHFKDRPLTARLDQAGVSFLKPFEGLYVGGKTALGKDITYNDIPFNRNFQAASSGKLATAPNNFVKTIYGVENAIVGEAPETAVNAAVSVVATPAAGAAAEAALAIGNGAGDKLAEQQANGTINKPGARFEVFSAAGMDAIGGAVVSKGVNKAFAPVVKNIPQSATKQVLETGAQILGGGGTGVAMAGIDTGFNALFMGENSNYNLSYKEYIKQGLSVEEAKERALEDTLYEPMKQGFVTGVGMGTVRGVPRMVSNIHRFNSAGEAVKRSGTTQADLIEQTKGFDRNSEAYKNVWSTPPTPLIRKGETIGESDSVYPSKTTHSLMSRRNNPDYSDNGDVEPRRNRFESRRMTKSELGAQYLLNSAETARQARTAAAYADMLGTDIAVRKLDNGVEGQVETVGDTPNKFRIGRIKSNGYDYGEGVYLDTDIFDGVKPRYWNNILTRFVYDNLAGKDVTVFDEDGNSDVISFAKGNERVQKDGANNSHRVIDKLARTKGNVNSLAVVQIDELLQTAKNIDTNSEHSHQWLDENGWEFRKTYIADKNNNIYETTLNIANAKDGRKILYALSNTKRLEDGDVSSAPKGEGLAHKQPTFSSKRVSQTPNDVNGYKLQSDDINAEQAEIGQNNGGRRKFISLSHKPKEDRIQTLAHESGHVLEDAESYRQFVQQVKTAIGYDDAVERVRSRHEQNGKTLSQRAAEYEVAADVLMNLLPNNAEEAERLLRVVKGNETLSDRIYRKADELSMVMKSKRKQVYTDPETGLRISYGDLIKAKKALEEALKEVHTTNASDGGTQYRIANIDGKKYVEADRKVVQGDTPKEWGKSVERYINDTIRGGKDVHLIAEDGDVLTITADTAGKAKFRNFTQSTDGSTKIMNRPQYRAKLNAESHIDEIAQVSKRGYRDVPDTKSHPFATDGFNYRTAYFKDFDGKYYKLTISVGKNGEINTVYNIGKMKEVPVPPRGSMADESINDSRVYETSGNRVSQNTFDVKGDSKTSDNLNADTQYRMGRNAEEANIYDYSKTFDEQIDDWKQGKIPQYDTLLVGETPEVLRNIGFNQLPVTINQKHVDYAINGTKDSDHTLGETMLKQLPQALKDPVAIIKSQTQPDRVVAILKLVHNGKSVVAPVEIDGYGRQNNIVIDSNAVTSVFAKGNSVTKQLFGAIQDEINGNTSVYYLNKKEAIPLMQRVGLQLPDALPRNDFIHSITDSGSNVKKKFKNSTYSQQFKRWFGDWENNPDEASKVVNEDGTPKIVYHGTDSEFTVFDITQSRSWDEVVDYDLPGAYFSESTDESGSYGGRMGSYYISIKKPFEGDVFALRDKLGTYRKVYDYLVSKGYDGIIDTEMGDGFHEYIVFKPEQIKSATDNIGTYDGDNPDIRYRVSKTAEQTETIAGRNLQNDLLNFSAGEGIRNRRYGVAKMIKEAYTLFDLGRNQEGEIRLIEAAEEYSLNKKGFDNPKNKKVEAERDKLILKFSDEFRKNYRAGKRFDIVNNKDKQSLQDLHEFNFNVRKYLMEYCSFG